MRKLGLSFLTVLMFLIALTPAAFAVDLQEGSRLVIAATETINDDLIYSGTSLTIDGTVKGDVFAFADSVIVNGTIEGNLFAFARVVDVNGRVTGTTLSAAADLLVAGRVDGSLVALAGNQTLTKDATLGRSLLTVGDEVRIQGTVERGALALAATLRLDGRVGRELRAYAQHLNLGESASVAGPVTYWSDKEAHIAPGAQTGEVTFHYDEWDHSRPTLSGILLNHVVIKFGGFLIVGLILLALFPALRTRFTRAVTEKPWQSPLVGLLILLVVPVAAVLLFVTLVGIPLFAMVVLLYPLAIYLGQVLLSWTAGRLIADRWEWLGRQNWALLFVTGAVVTTLLTSVPYVSGALGFVAVAYGLGGLYYAYTQSKQQAAA